MSGHASQSPAERVFGVSALIIGGGTLVVIMLACAILLVRAGAGLLAVSHVQLGAAVLGTLGLSAVAAVISGPIGVAAATGIRWMLRGRRREVARKGVSLLAELPPIAWAIAALLLLPAPGNGWTAWLQVGVVLGLASAPVVTREALRHFDRVPVHMLLQAVALGASPMSAVARIGLPIAAPGLLRAVGMGALRGMGDTFVVVVLLHGLPGMQSTALPQLVLEGWQTSPDMAYAACGAWLLFTTAAHALFTSRRTP